jgi:fermentation-respiration switch protein FrsA (DUF1100 family)
MKLEEAEVLKRLEHLPVLVVNGSGDTLAGLEEAKWNYEAAKGPKEMVVIESVNQDPKLMEEAIGNHVFKGKEKEAINKTLVWLRTLVVS